MATSSLPLPELHFLSPQITPKRRLALSRFYSCKSISLHPKYRVNITTRIRAIKDEPALIEERQKELVKRVNDVEWTGNGAARSNGSMKEYVNGSLGVVESEIEVSNGSLVKYVNGNGATAGYVEDVETSKSKEDGRKKRIEEIGKEDAWFKQSGKDPVEV